MLGNITAKYRWFAIFYLVSMFAVLPLVFIALSLAGSIYVVMLVSIIGVLLFVIGIVTILQRKVPRVLPQKLRDWKWLPRPLRSLRPYDNLVSKLPCCSAAPSEKDDNDNSDDDDDDGFRSYTGRSNFHKNSDFVFLSGNKIPPPSDKEHDLHQRNPSKPITRIVPTRVIRNISNANGDFSPVYTNSNNGVNRGNAIPPPTNAPVEKSDKTESNGGVNISPTISTNSSSTLSSNTLPLPTSFEESQPAKQDSSHIINTDASRNNSIPVPSSPSYNLGYSSSSVESFAV